MFMGWLVDELMFSAPAPPVIPEVVIPEENAPVVVVIPEVNAPVVAVIPVVVIPEVNAPVVAVIPVVLMPLLITVSAAPLSYTVNVPEVTVGNSTERIGAAGKQVG
jgi:hypothetical protein